MLVSLHHNLIAAAAQLVGAVDWWYDRYEGIGYASMDGSTYDIAIYPSIKHSSVTVYRIDGDGCVVDTLFVNHQV